MYGKISHASRCPPDVILHRSFTRPSTAIAVIEGLGMRLQGSGIKVRVLHKQSQTCFNADYGTVSGTVILHACQIMLLSCAFITCLHKRSEMCTKCWHLNVAAMESMRGRPCEEVLLNLRLVNTPLVFIFRFSPCMHLSFLSPTHADWDLGVCLTYECQRKQIRKQTYFSQWIDLRAVYKVCCLPRHYIKGCHQVWSC